MNDKTEYDFNKMVRTVTDAQTALSERLDELEGTVDNSDIYTALAKAQLEIKNAEFDAEAKAGSYSYQYATLASVLSAVREPLNKQGIAIFQPTWETGEPGIIGIQTVLAHTSGQTLVDTLTMPLPKMDPQGIGSCRTYMRRYSLMAMTGIAAVDDLDAELTKADPTDYERITPKEANSILVTAENLFGDRSDDVVNRMLAKVFSTSDVPMTTVADIPAGQADAAIQNLENLHDYEQKKAKKEKKTTKAE